MDRIALYDRSFFREAVAQTKSLYDATLANDPPLAAASEYRGGAEPEVYCRLDAELVTILQPLKLRQQTLEAWSFPASLPYFEKLLGQATRSVALPTGS